jgi:hypothetical protein
MSSQTTRQVSGLTHLGGKIPSADIGQIIPRESLWEPLGDLLGSTLQLTSRADLNALSLVSKASRASTEPFLRTILRRPELAAYVRRVALLGDSFYTAP